MNLGERYIVLTILFSNISEFENFQNKQGENIFMSEAKQLTYTFCISFINPFFFPPKLSSSKIIVILVSLAMLY